MDRKKPQNAEVDELELFREAMRDVRPLEAPARVEHRRRPRPVPRFRLADESDALLESLREDPLRSDLETGEELLYLRAGENPRLLKRLRRGEFPIAAELDLHGLTEQRAGVAIREFLAEAQRERWQCVRIIHGKGLRSGPDGPVLKPKTASVLHRRDDVLAFANARPADGGTGAVLVLLRRK